MCGGEFGSKVEYVIVWEICINVGKFVFLDSCEMDIRLFLDRKVTFVQFTGYAAEAKTIPSMVVIWLFEARLSKYTRVRITCSKCEHKLALKSGMCDHM